MTNRRSIMVRAARVLTVSTLGVVAVAGVILLVVASPVAWGWLARDRADWQQLGDVGQAYGGASAILSGLALCGIAVSLFLQWRQGQVAQLYSARHHQLELAKMSLETPESMMVDGAAAPLDRAARSLVIVNLWVSHWATAWQFGAMSEAEVRASAARLFETAAARRWWAVWSPTYATSARSRRFVTILTEESAECAQHLDPAIRDPAPRVPAAGAPRERTGLPDTAVKVAAAVLAATAIAAVVRVRCRPVTTASAVTRANSRLAHTPIGRQR